MKHYFLTLITLCIFQTSIYADKPSANSEIEQLSQEMHEARKKARNAEIEAQALLQTEWKAYAEKIEEADQYSEKAEALEQHIETLRDQKTMTTPHNTKTQE
jgi:cell division protein FtsB